MKEKQSFTGRCLCGGVRVAGDMHAPDVAACHCDMCRRCSAGPFMEVTCDQVAFEGEEHIGRIRSLEWAERGFCKTCGSNLFYHIVGTDEYQISVGLLDDQTRLRLVSQVFIDRKPPFYAFSNDTKTITEAEVIAEYAPPQ